MCVSFLFFELQQTEATRLSIALPMYLSSALLQLGPNQELQPVSSVVLVPHAMRAR